MQSHCDVSYDDRMVAVLKDSVDVPILYCSSLMIHTDKKITAFKFP